MVAVAFLFFAARPDFYLPSEQFDETYLTTTLESLTTHWPLIYAVEKQLALAADPEREKAAREARDMVIQIITHFSDWLLRDRQEYRRYFLEHPGKRPAPQLPHRLP